MRKDLPGARADADMSQEIPKFTDTDGATSLIRQLGESFAVVKNPPYIFPAYEVYALASPRTQLVEGLEAAVMDMDGTTTTTEVLCTGALEFMVQHLCGTEKTGKPLLDHERDFPHIIGNSTTKHVEYLINTYGNGFMREAVCRSFLYACAWNLSCALDPRRSEETRTALRVQGLDFALTHPCFEQLCNEIKEHPDVEILPADALIAVCKNRLRMESIADLTRIGIEVYYQRYHESLQHIATGKFVPNADQSRPIEPMPGIGIALAMLKGWLGKEVAALGEMLATPLRKTDDYTPEAITAGLEQLPALGRYFADNPAKIGLVTSSIAAEAKIVLGEVFRVIQKEIAEWPLAAERREFLIKQFADPDHIYDACITASDSSEIRLKPHRDLYAIALHTMGIPPEQFHRVAGFEDSESGTIAIRAAGIPLCCALPFTMTRNHHFEAATQVCPGGMPEVILLKRFFLPTA